MTVYLKINNVKYTLVLAERLEFFCGERSAAKRRGVTSIKFFHFRSSVLLYYIINGNDFEETSKLNMIWF